MKNILNKVKLFVERSLERDSVLLVISVLVSLAIEGIRALLKQLVSFVHARRGR